MNHSNTNKFHASSILSEQTAETFGALNNAIIATIVNSIILVVVLWSYVDNTILIIWFASLFIVSFLRAYTGYRYKIISPSITNSLLWNKRFITGSFVASIIWGASSIWLFPVGDISRQVFLAFVIGGMAAGAVTSLSYIKHAVYSYLSIILIPLSLRFFFSDTELSIEMGTMISIYYIILLQAAKQSNFKNIQNISMRIENLEQERALNKSERRYKMLLETASDAFFLHDLNGKILDVNNEACHSLGYTRDELLSLSVTDIMNSDATGRPNLDWTALKDGEKAQLEGIHIRKDGTTFPVDVSLGAIHVEDSTLLSVIVRDITERKRIERMKDEFISTVSHELRTPLTSIRGALGLITGGAAGETSQQLQELLTIANNNTERLLFLINDILDIQKIESGELEMKTDEIELIPFLKQAIQDNSSYAEQYGVMTSLDYTVDKNIIINGSKDRLMQVMANLLSNAYKFSHANGSVEISVTENKDNIVRVSVVDYGEGITEEFKPRLFDKFTQQDSSDTRNKGGTGLGLNISKAIIEKHGGVFGFSSNLKKGSTFYFDLPKLK